LLVEAPFILVVLAPEPPRQALDRVPEGLRQLRRGPPGGGDRVEPILDPDPHAPEEVGDGLGGLGPGLLPGPRLRCPRLGAYRAAPSYLPVRSPRLIDGPWRRPVVLVD